jgi:hypothetical protein
LNDFRKKTYEKIHLQNAYDKFRNKVPLKKSHDSWSIMTRIVSTKKTTTQEQQTPEAETQATTLLMRIVWKAA